MTATDPNPYESPSAATPSPPSGMLPARPVSPKVFGILGLVFGVLGIFVTLLGLVLMSLPSIQDAYQKMGHSLPYRIISALMGIVGVAILIFASIGLLRYRHFGRIAFNVYAVFAIVAGVLNGGYLVYKSVSAVAATDGDPSMIGGTVGGTVGGLVGGLAGLIFPVLGLIFLNRAAVKAALS